MPIPYMKKQLKEKSPGMKITSLNSIRKLGILRFLIFLLLHGMVYNDFYLSIKEIIIYIVIYGKYRFAY